MKRFWLPNQKGVEIFPNAIQQPTKLVVRGVPPNTPAYRALAERYGAALKQFQSKCQREYSLSDNQVYKRRVPLRGDARATYTNIHGQEILELEVTPQELAELAKQIPKRPWDWALVEIHVPLTGYAVHLNAKAIRVVPRSVETGIINDGYVTDEAIYPGNVDGLSPPVLKYPQGGGIYDVALTISGAEQVASLAVDLRRFAGAPVNIDLYAVLATGSAPEPDSYSAPLPTAGTTTRTYLGTTTLDSTTNTFQDANRPSTLWPFEGASLVVDPISGPGGYPLTTAASVSAAVAPLAPVTLYPQNLINYAPFTSTVDQYQNRHFTNIVYDHVSGLPIAYTDYGFENYNGHGGGLNSNLWIEDWRISETRYTRSVTTLYTYQLQPADCLGDIRILGGFDTMDWSTAQVTNDATTFERFCVPPDTFLKTVIIGKDVSISGGPGVDYALLGEVAIFPFQYTASFKPA